MARIIVQAGRVRAKVLAVTKQAEYQVRFWGVRGSIAASGAGTARYGGNTSSIEIRCGERLILLDAGTGMRYLGNRLAAEGPLDADLFFTHTHFDHVCGLPFFKPFFQPRNAFRLWAGHLEAGMTLHELLHEFMMAPLFPVSPGVFAAKMEFRDFKGGETLAPAPGIVVRTAVLNHPNGATGYRIEYGGKSVCYVTDTEHVRGTPDRNVLALIAGADIVIYDCMYTDEEYAKSYVGWAIRPGRKARACARPRARNGWWCFTTIRTATTTGSMRSAEKPKAAMPGTVVAREGLTLAPDPAR